MKTYLLRTITLIIISGLSRLQAQSVYNASDFAVAGDTFYITGASASALNFDTTGNNINWDYSTLSGNTQRMLTWRMPNQTGFSIVQWPYLYNSANVNLSSTDGNTIMIGNLEYSEPNDFYLKNNNTLQQKASSYKIAIGSQSFSVKNVYTTADTIFHFPLQSGNLDSSYAQFISSVGNLYYRSAKIKRVNQVNGWGSVTTPYGTFTNSLRLESYLTEIDSIVVDTLQPFVDTVYSREIKWLDASEAYPLLVVYQTRIGGVYVTSKVEYLDNQQYFQPNALFVFYPVSPFMGDTVVFQNLSTNAYQFNWDFSDASSGVNNTSALTNPEHVFANPGVYMVRLIAFNGALSDTLVLPVNVRDTVPPVAAFTFSPSTIYEGDTVYFTNASTHNTVSAWNFGDAGSGSGNVSVLLNPDHVYTAAGVYTVRLIAGNSISSDTLDVSLTVNPLIVGVNEANPEKGIAIYPVPADENITIRISESSTFRLLILNASGGTIMNYKTAGDDLVEINTADWAEGIYFIKVIGEKEIRSKKIIVAHGSH